MLDKRSLNVLKALNKLSETGCFKVATCEDILSILQNKSQYDYESIKHIMELLEKQEYITIKYSEENTYCYMLLPKARIVLDQINAQAKQKKLNPPILTSLVTCLASFIGTMLALFIFFYATF